jgi:hypothetical protein
VPEHENKIRDACAHFHINGVGLGSVSQERRIPSSGMLCRVILVRTDVSEEHSVSMIKVTITRIGELATVLAVTSNQLSVRWLLVTVNIPSSLILVILIMETLCSSETLVLTRVTRQNISKDSILHSHHCENLKSYKEFLLTHLGHSLFILFP